MLSISAETIHALPASPAEHLWRASGRPDPQWPVESMPSFACATCGVASERGVPTSVLVSDTFSRAADFLRFGPAACVSCAWMYSDPKRHHRSVLAIGERIWWPALGAESATEARLSWSAALDELLAADEGVPVTGVLTTDPKPRLWPLARVSSTSRLGLYVHAPDYDLSGYVELDRRRLASARAVIDHALQAGYSKRACAQGLGVHKAFARDIRAGLGHEARLRVWRAAPEFIPALLVTLTPSKAVPS